jgi:ATP-dependent RNA helicase RhlE
LVFTRTKHGADRVVRDLERAGVRAMAIHGNKSQTARQKALESFKTGDIRVLVATDIAARGLDINDLACVINYDLPNIPETYVHRIGRTGRAGRDGIAISFCMYDELPYLADIQKLTKKAIPEITEHPYPMEVFENAPKPQRTPRPQQAGANNGRQGRGKPPRGREKAATPAQQKKQKKQNAPQQKGQGKPGQNSTKQGRPQQGNAKQGRATAAQKRAVPPEIQALRNLSQSRDPQAPTTRKNAQLDESLLHRRPRRGHK